jgi:hypothetical protein
MNLDEKIREANSRLKHCIELSEFSEKKYHWIWVDFINEDRFTTEIREDRRIDCEKATIEQMVLHACNKLDLSLEQIYIDEFIQPEGKDND